MGVILLAITFIGSAGQFGFGYAKPTPVNTLNLEGGPRGEALVAAAGPISNLVLAAAGALPLRYLLANEDLALQVPMLAIILQQFVVINIVLMSSI